MKYIILLISIILAHVCLGQNNPPIDSKNGFGPFILGTKVGLYEKNLRLDYSISLGQKYYIYTGSDLKTVNDFKIEKINIGFDHEVLFYLDVYFKDAGNYESLKLFFESEYGESIPTANSNETGVVKATSWQGVKVVAQLVQFNSEADEDDRNKIVFMIFKKE